MRIVLDSSVLIAAAITRAGVCAELMDDALTSHELILSRFILDEVDRKLRSKFRFVDRDVRQLVRFLKRNAILVEPGVVPAGVCRDPDDRPVLGTAVAGGALLLITGDKDLLTLKAYSGIAIIGPADFWHRVMK